MIVLAILVTRPVVRLLALAARAVRGIPDAMARIERTWAATAFSWVLLLAILAALGSLIGEHAEHDLRGESATLGTMTIFLLAFTVLGVVRVAARRLGQREVRESGLRGFNPAQAPTNRRDHHALQDQSIAESRTRLEALEAWQEEMEELRRRTLPEHEAMWESMPAHDAMVSLIRDAHKADDLPVPAELLANAPTVPQRLKLVWDAAERAEGA